MSKCIIKDNEVLMKQYDQLAAALDPEILKLNLPKPALRALINLNIKSFEDIRILGLKSIGAAHGMGPKSLKLIAEILK